MIEKLPFFFESLRSAYQKGLDPIELIEEVYRRITRVNDPGIFINLREKEEVKHEAAKLSEKKVLNKPPLAVSNAASQIHSIKGFI